ncbi:MAG: HAMP domain-containing sensor histidine kinase [Rikenellaceae bacterium]
MCKREQAQIESHIKNIYDTFDCYCENYFSESGYNQDILDRCVNVFNSYALLIVNFKDDEIEFSNRNIFVTKETLLEMLDSVESLIFRDNRVVIPLVKCKGDRKIALYINISLEGHKADYDNFVYTANNKTIVSSDNFTVAKFSRYDNIVSSPRGKSLFSFTESVKKVDFLLVNLLFIIGFVLFLIFQLIYLSEHTDSVKNGVKRLVFSTFLIVFPLIIIYIADFSNIVIWLISIALLLSSYLSHRIFTHSVNCNISKEKISFNTLMLLGVLIISVGLLLSVEIDMKFNNYMQYSILDLIPTAIISCSLINYIASIDIIEKNIEGKKYKFLLLLLILIIAILLYFNFELGLIFLLLSVFAILDVIIARKYHIFRSHYLLLIAITAICIFTESNIDKMEYISSCENEYVGNLHGIDKEKIVSYDKISKHNEYYNKIDELISISLFSLVAILGLGFIVMKFRTLPLKIRLKGSLPYRFYLIIAAIVVIVIVVSRLFINYSDNNQFNRHIVTTYSFLKSDFENGYYRNPNWHNSLSERYNIEVDVYNEKGEIIDFKNSNNKNLDNSPNQLSGSVLTRMQYVGARAYLTKENNLFSREYTTLYLLTPDNMILRIPFDRNRVDNSTQTLFFRIIIIFFAILVAILLYAIVCYYNSSLPLKALRNSENLVKSRQYLTISPLVEDCSQMKNMLVEYNKMIGELEDQYKLQIAIDQQENLNKISRMLAHEIKNPLTPILLSAQLALRLKQSDNPRWLETIEDTLNTIIFQTERISQIISKIMSRSTIFQTNSSKIDLISLLSEVEKFYSPYKNITFSIENDSKSSSTIFMDSNLLWSVITNITVNAIDAIQEQSESNGHIIFRVSEESQKLKISILNNGKPIPETIQNEIFKYKYTTKESGNGLGLFFAHHIITREKGNLYLNKHNLEFTEFVVEIPLERGLEVRD